jgi:hypothetical protein
LSVKLEIIVAPQAATFLPKKVLIIGWGRKEVLRAKQVDFATDLI